MKQRPRIYYTQSQSQVSLERLIGCDTEEVHIRIVARIPWQPIRR